MSGLKYKILSHTADLRLEVFGRSLEDLFSNAATAIAEILAPKREELRIKNEELKKERIKIQSANLNTLLVDFLNEILAKSNINKCVYLVSSVRLQASGENAAIEAELAGYKVKEFEEDIKAVTYTEVDVKKYNGIWKTKLVMDI